MTLTIAQQEAKYDAERSGAAYVKPADERVCLDILLKPTETLQITRYTRHLDGSIPSDPWTQYDLGEASISIQDAGGGNICLDREMLEFDDNAQLLDLGMLLNDPRVLAALDPSKEDTNGIISVLEDGDGKSDAQRALDRRFDAVVDRLFDLPEAQMERGVLLLEGFVAGAAA